MIITPTIGRVVWYHPFPLSQPDLVNAAVIIAVDNDRCVNVLTFTEYGEPVAFLNAPLLQEGDKVPERSYASWIPYQLGQDKAVSEPTPQLPLFAEPERDKPPEVVAPFAANQRSTYFSQEVTTQ